MTLGKLSAQVEQTRRPWHSGSRRNIWSQYKDFHPLHSAVDRAIAVPSPTHTIVRSGEAFAPLDPGQIDDRPQSEHTDFHRRHHLPIQSTIFAATMDHSGISHNLPKVLNGFLQAVLQLDLRLPPQQLFGPANVGAPYFWIIHRQGRVLDLAV